MRDRDFRWRKVGVVCFFASSVIFAVAAARAAVTSAEFGTTSDGRVWIYTLTNAHGIEARIMTYGATIVSLKTPDKTGALKNIVLGFDSLDNYLAGVPYYGATVGRFANRVANAQFSVDGTVHHLAANDGANSLHGGNRGFDKRLWSAQAVDRRRNQVRLKYISADGEEGYPGRLTVYVTYELSDEDALKIEYAATTTAATPVNLANHAYFNLTGEFGQTVLHHVLRINADAFTPVNNVLIPTGERRAVAGTPFDFRVPTEIGKRIDDPDEQLGLGHGYDHNWILTRPSSGATRGVAAVLTDPSSGRVVEIRTTQPGLQFYSGNFMDGKPAGKGSVYNHRTGVCLETQHFPDSPNQSGFPNALLRPGEKFAQTTLLQFRVLKQPP